MKKKFELNLDAALVITLLFVITLGLNVFQYFNYQEVLTENIKLQLQSVQDQLNLESKNSYIAQLTKEIESSSSN